MCKEIRRIIIGIILLWVGYLIILFASKHYESNEHLITAMDWMHGRGQKKITESFENSLFFRHSAIKTYNQLRYSFLGEGTEGWIIGKDGYIYDKNQTQNYLLDSVTSTYEEYEEYAFKISQLQAELNERGKSFCYLITPIKAQLCAEHIPTIYSLMEKPNGEYNNYEALKKALEKYDVVYFDATPVLERIKAEGEYPTYGPTRTHWTSYATACTLQELFRYMEDVYGKKMPILTITPFVREPDPTDIELATLMELRFYETDKNPYDVYVNYERKSDEKMMFFGTSFCGQATDVLTRGNQAFNQIKYYVYLTRKQTYSNYGFTDVPYEEGKLISSEIMWNDMLESNVVIMESQGMNGILGSHIKFLDYMLNKFENGNQIPIAELDGSGWSVDEGNYRWGVCNDLYVNVVQPVKGKDTLVKVALNSYNESRKVNVYVNDTKITTISVSSDCINQYDFVIPERLVDENRNITIKLEIEGRLYSPQELDGTGWIGDKRTLSLGIADLWVFEECRR